MATTTLTTTARTTSGRRPWARITCAAAAAATVIPFALSQLSGTTGAEINAGLIEDRSQLLIGTYVAVWVAAGLFLAAVRLGRTVPGAVGAVITAAGSAVALLYAGYYSAFGAGAVLVDPDRSGPGIGEAAWVVLNAMELTRFAPAFALVVAALLAGSALPRWVRVVAALLAVTTLVPMTAWVAALLVPVWLGVSAAAVDERA